MSDIAIKVENLSKYYKLGVINSGTLSRDLQSRIYKMFGKADPNKQIGAIESDADGFWALKDLSFEIKKGDRVGIIGRNGAGKSTLLKMLSQISSPTEGKIYIDGKIASLLEVGTGFNPELTGRENIYLNGAILGMKKKEVDRKIDEIIAFSEIEKHIDTPVKRYSSGMYVRLAFAVAAHLDSDILIADEVLAVGDASFQKKALGKMNELSTGQGRTVLFVSHNMSQVKNLCTKGIILDHGTLKLEAPIDKAIGFYLLNNKDFNISDITEIHDWNVKRGNGFVHFKKVGFNASKYSSGEKIVFKGEVFASEKVNGLFFYMDFRTESGITVSSIDFCVEKEEVKENQNYCFEIEIDSKNLRKGMYNTYIWLGDEAALSQGNPDNFEVLDGLLPPVIIEREQGIHETGCIDIPFQIK